MTTKVQKIFQKCEKVLNIDTFSHKNAEKVIFLQVFCKKSWCIPKFLVTLRAEMRNYAFLLVKLRKKIT